VRWWLVLVLVLAGTARADVTKAPKLVQAVAPAYPPAALAAGKQADVKVRLHVDATGVVTAVDVVAPVGDGFDEAARDAALQYVFEPGEIDGKPAPVVVETTIHFVIEQEPPPPPVPPPPPGAPNHAGPPGAPVTVQGTVVERGTRRKLAGVIVSLAGRDAVSGEDGSFYFHGVAPGHYDLIAVEPRFDRLDRPIAIAAGEVADVRLWMRPRGGNPYETVVEGEREELEVTKRALSHQQLGSVPGTFGDPVRVIQTLPGMGRAPFGLGLLLIRGSDPDDSAVFLDGHEVPALYHFLGGPSIFNVEMLDSLELYPGGFPARFGRRHGGIVALETRPTKTDGYHGNFKISVLDAGGYLRAPVTKDLSVAVAGRRSYVDAFLNSVLPEPDPGATRIVTPVYYDYDARADYNLHAHGRLSLYAIGSSDTLHVLDQDPDAQTSTNLGAAIRFFRIIGAYTRSLGGDLQLVLSPAWGRDTAAVTDGMVEGAMPSTSFDAITNDLSYRARIHGRASARVLLDTGVDITSRATTYAALLPLDDGLTNGQGVDVPPTRAFRGATSLAAAAYADVGIDVSGRLRLIPSLRADAYLFDSRSRQSLDPRLAWRYRSSDAWTLKGYVGKFTEPPTAEAFDERFGNPRLGLEYGTHYGLGYIWKPAPLWSIESEAYYADREHIVISSDAIVDNGDGTFSRLNSSNTGRKYSYGVETIIRREITEHAYGWLTYTYSRSRVRRHIDDPWLPTRFDQPHVLNAVASWRPGAGFELGARFQLATGRPDTPIVGATFDADTGGYQPVMGAERSTRVPTFSELDVRVERDWLYRTWSLGVFVDVINVLDVSNAEATQYDYRYRDSSPIQSFPILPTLGVTGSW
jgi:TonB family protein